MPHPENIIPPKKGEIRNPNGKPKGTLNRSTLLKKWIEVHTKLKHPITKKEESGTVADLITLALINKAITGDIQAIKEINDTLYGKIPNRDELTGADGKELNPPTIIFNRHGNTDSGK
jgi:hypothetical protein